MSRFIEAWNRAYQAAQHHYVEQLKKLMEPYGIKISDSPRELYLLIVEMLSNATEVKMAIDAEELYLFELPLGYVPDTWPNLIEMMTATHFRSETGLKILKPPIGTPPEIAKAWVGMTLPFHQRILTPLVYITPELEALGVTSNDNKCYLLDSKTTTDLLTQFHPEAGLALKKRIPFWDSPKQLLIFDGDSGEIVPLKQDKTA